MPSEAGGRKVSRGAESFPTRAKKTPARERDLALEDVERLTLEVGRKEDVIIDLQKRLAMNRTPPRKSEEAKLTAFFRTKAGEALGSQGDHDNLSPAQTAIRAIRDLQEELKNAKADRLEVLNNQAEAITELRQRVLPEGWAAVVLERELIGPAIRPLHVLLKIEETPGGSGWNWRTFFVNTKGHIFTGRGCSEGHTLSLTEAITKAEQAGKKALR